MSWFLLVLAGLFEVCWPTGLKMAQTSEHSIGWILFSAIGMSLSGVFLYYAQKTIPIGVAYAAWVGIGALGTYLISIRYFGEPVLMMSVVGLAMIVGGVVVLKLSLI